MIDKLKFNSKNNDYGNLYWRSYFQAGYIRPSSILFSLISKGLSFNILCETVKTTWEVLYGRQFVIRLSNYHCPVLDELWNLPKYEILKRGNCSEIRSTHLTIAFLTKCKNLFKTLVCYSDYFKINPVFRLPFLQSFQSSKMFSSSWKFYPLSFNDENLLANVLYNEIGTHSDAEGKSAQMHLILFINFSSPKQFKGKSILKFLRKHDFYVPRNERAKKQLLGVASLRTETGRNCYSSTNGKLIKRVAIYDDIPYVRRSSILEPNTGLEN